MQSTRVALLLAVGSLLTFAPVVARADDPEPEVSTQPTASDPWSHLLAVEVIGGVDTPFGLVGGAIVLNPIRNLAFDLGGGYSRDGGRVAGGARLVLPHANGALGFRLGLAGGELAWDTTSAAQSAPGAIGQGGPAVLVEHRHWDFTAFLDTSLYLEFRANFGGYLRLTFGAEHTLTAPNTCTVDGGSRCAPGGELPMRAYVGLAAGYAFDL